MPLGLLLTGILGYITFPTIYQTKKKKNFLGKNHIKTIKRAQRIHLNPTKFQKIARNLKNMKAGNLKLLLLTLLLNFKIVNLPAEQRIDLNVLQPTFEEDNEILDETDDILGDIDDTIEDIESTRRVILEINYN